MNAELFPCPPPPVTAAEVAEFIEWLSARPGWHRAAWIAAALRVTDRKVRQLAQHANGKVVSSPGGKGYQHTRHCTQEDVSHAIAQLRSQAGNMRLRAQQIEAEHRKF